METLVVALGRGLAQQGLNLMCMGKGKGDPPLATYGSDIIHRLFFVRLVVKEDVPRTKGHCFEKFQVQFIVYAFE